MKQLLARLHTLKRWQKNLIIFIVVFLCVYWLMILSDVGSWWHWNEWIQHIRAEH